MDLIKTILAVGAGSFLGGAGRYLVSLVLKGVSKGFPWATLAVNLVGCFLIGLLWGIFSKNGSEGSNWALFLTVGLCGGFTTFYVLKGGVGDAAGRQYLGIRRVRVNQCDCGCCPRCVGVFSGTLNSNFSVSS